MSILSLSRNKLYGLLAVIAVASGLAVGTSFRSNNSQANSMADDVPLVRTQVITQAGTNQIYTYSGEVRGRHESQLAFQVSGKIVRRQVDLGSTVKSGQILMQIDPIDIQQTVNIQTAQVDAAKSQLDLAEKNLKRYAQLFKEDVISRAQLERHQSAYDMATAAWKQAISMQTQGSNQLGYSSLCANKAGVVSAISAEVGQVVGPGQPVVIIVQDGAREIEISVPENRIKEINDATQIKVSFWALPDCLVDGRIREIAPMAEAISRTYKVRVSLMKLPPEVKLGMTASVAITHAGNQTFTPNIPLSALYQTKTTPSVWVVSNDTVHLRPVKIGVFATDQVEVLSGLNSGDVLVTAGVHKLREGQKVKTIIGEK